MKLNPRSVISAVAVSLAGSALTGCVTAPSQFQGEVYLTAGNGNKYKDGTVYECKSDVVPAPPAGSGAKGIIVVDTVQQRAQNILGMAMERHFPDHAYLEGCVAKFLTNGLASSETMDRGERMVEPTRSTPLDAKAIQQFGL